MSSWIPVFSEETDVFPMVCPTVHANWRLHIWGLCSSISQEQNKCQSFVHPNLMSGLMAKVVLYLGHIKIKLNQIQATVQEEEDRDQCFAMPCLIQAA